MNNELPDDGRVYRPIVKPGDHLVKSRENGSRVRGVAQDANNKTTDIVEWEEVDVRDLAQERESQYRYEPSKEAELTPEQKEMADAIGVAIAELIIAGASQLNEHVIHPWWENSAKPWIKEKTMQARLRINKRKKDARELSETPFPTSHSVSAAKSEDAQIENMLDQTFEDMRFDLSSDEAKMHVMSIIYHMIETAREIKILSRARICEQVDDKALRLEKQEEAERYLTQKVAGNIDQLLSDESLSLNITTSKQIFELLGGGVRINGEYVPIESKRLKSAIDDPGMDSDDPEVGAS